MGTTCPIAAAAASAAADVAVRKTFAILGVDLDTPKEVEQFRQDLRYGAELREAGKRKNALLFGALLTAAISVMIGIMPKLFEIFSSGKGH